MQTRTKHVSLTSHNKWLKHKFNLYKGGVGASEADKRKKTAIHGIFGAYRYSMQKPIGGLSVLTHFSSKNNHYHAKVQPIKRVFIGVLVNTVFCRELK